MRLYKKLIDDFFLELYVLANLRFYNWDFQKKQILPNIKSQCAFFRV